MKRLYIIFIGMLMMLWFGFAADFAVTNSPSTQTAISGSMVSLSVSVSNSTWFNAYFTQSFPTQIKYTNANILPINNPALALGIETTPRWLLSAGQSLNLTIQAQAISQSFPTLNLVSNVVDVNNLLNVYTSAIASVDPISDITVIKTLISNKPQFTWDAVTYNIEVKNIGSAIATGIRLVDVRPNSIVTFPNQWFVNGVLQIPTIYNGLPNNYLFNINDLTPGSSANVQINWTMDAMHTAGQSFTNQSFVLMDSAQYSTTNDTTSISNTVRWVPNVYINVSQLSSWPAVIGDLITYLISYGNDGTETATGVVLQNVLPGEFSFLSSSVTPTSQSANTSLWSLWSLSAGQNWQIILTGSFLGWISVWTIFANNAQISTTDTELNYTDNSDSVTWYVISLPTMWIQIYANNLTNPTRNINTWTNILAVSGDIVQLQIVITNTGNVSLTGNISLSNITGFVWYAWFTSWTAFLTPWTSQTITLTGLVGPTNYVWFTPRSNLSYDTTSLFDTVSIQEPLVCGDGLITQNEVCDTNWQIWTFLPWQHCEERNWQCLLITENITNTVCMSYTTSLWTGEQCMSVTVDYDQEDILEAQCRYLSAPYWVVIVDEDNEWSLEFTCVSEDNVVADEIRIDCGNWQEWITHNSSSFTYKCEYGYDENWNIDDNVYDVQCYVDDHTCEDCHKSARIDQWFYGICGDGSMDDWEECDLWGDENEEVDIDNYLDSDRNYSAWRYANDGYYCEDCRIRQNNNEFVYQPPQCLWTNTTISIMENELMPFRWRLWNRQEQIVRSDYDCEDIDNDEDKTIINKDSMKCTFAIYDGNDHQQVDDDAVNTFVTDCFQEDDSIMFDYFEDTYKIDFDKVSGRYVYPMNTIFDGNVDAYGEYKLVLEKVEYDYCDPNTKEWENGRTYQWICEVNFALTRPYIMQISTFGIDPVATDASDFLKDFYDMKWNLLIGSTDINETIDVDSTDYGFNSDVLSQMSSFKNRYEPLALTVDNNFKVNGNKTIGDLFNNWVVKKVPNQLIFFVKWNGQLTLKQLTHYFPQDPFTIYVEGMDVLVEWSVTTNGMIITDQNISFEDDSSQNYCQNWWQVVNWIFVAKWWFESISRTRNITKSNQRCVWWNLRVKWVLIWDGVENLIDNRRSHLNTWFDVASNLESSIKRERKNEIFEWSALLIEYNPNLWTKLPPGADSFTETLDVYRK